MNHRGRGILLRLLQIACAVLLALAGSLPARPAAAGVDPAENVRLLLTVETPQEGAEIGGEAGGLAFIAGKALAQTESAGQIDVVFAVDQSRSTGDPSQADVNGDGRIDRRGCAGVPRGAGLLALIAGVCGTASDSVLNAELIAVRTLLQQLDPRTTRVGIVSFNGERGDDKPDAALRCALTNDYALVEDALEKIRREGPGGQTNMQAGVELATRELTGAPDAYTSAGQKTPRRILVLLSDGQPTLPVARPLEANRKLAIVAARQAGRKQIRVDTFGIGPSALGDPVALVEMARLTSGIFTPVSRPGDLQPVFEQIDFSNVDVLRIANRTNQKDAEYTLRNADGTFAALVEMVPGRNTIEVYARTKNGVESTRELTLNFRQGAENPAFAANLLDERNRLLQKRLADLRDRNVQIREVERRDLERRIAEERERAEARAREIRVDAQGVDPEPEP